MMTRIAFACLLAASGFGQARAADVLTLQQAVARALSHNAELAMDAPGHEAAAADVAAGLSGYRPRVDVEQLFVSGNNPVYVFGTLLTQQRFTTSNFAIPSLNRPDATHNLQTRLAVQQTLWDAGRTARRVETARLALEMTDRGHDEHVRQLLLGVVDAYYAVSLGHDAWEAAQVAVESANAILAQARDRVKAGLAVDADFLRSQVLLAAAQQREIETRGQLDLARARLNQLMGEPMEASFGETASLRPTKLSVPAEESLRVEQRKRRPDYQRLSVELRQCELEVVSRQAEFLPVLGAFTSWEADNPSFKSAGGANWTAGVSLRWNLFAGGADGARLQAARHRLEQKRRQVAAVESAMALEIHGALIRLRSNEQQVEVSEAAEAQSKEGLRILKNRYDAGLATMTDLLSAESQRAVARASLSEAIYRYRLSLAQIEYVAGTLSSTSTAMNP
jgi:outer membrane protein TolC